MVKKLNWLRTKIGDEAVINPEKNMCLTDITRLTLTTSSFSQSDPSLASLSVPRFLLFHPPLYFGFQSPVPLSFRKITISPSNSCHSHPQHLINWYQWRIANVRGCVQPLPLYSSTPPKDSSGRGGAVRNILSVEVHSLWMILHMVGFACTVSRVVWL